MNIFSISSSSFNNLNREGCNISSSDVDESDKYDPELGSLRNGEEDACCAVDGDCEVEVSPESSL